MSVPTQQLMDQIKSEVLIEKKLALIELMGLEGKNQYEWRLDSNGVRGKGQVIAFTTEESDCFNRLICGPGREAKFSTHIGDKSGKVTFTIKKDQYICCCFCISRPHSTVTDSNGTVMGEIRDPFKICAMKNIVIDGNSGKPKYFVKGSCLTAGMCCPCLADQDFDISDAGGKTVGSMRRMQQTVMEFFCPAMNTWVVQFPPNATATEKTLLAATQHMLDVNYFDPPRGNSGGN